MKHTPFAQRISRRLATGCFAILLLGPGVARAAECPASSPEEPQERRRLAKEWFATAEKAENDSDDVEATRAYACSYKMVAHPFTAINLGRVAERSGDNELALKMFKAYLTLKPDAQDKDVVAAKVKALEEKMAASKEAESSEAAASTENATETPAEPGQEELAPPPMPKPAPVVQAKVPVQPQPEEETPSHLAEWIVGGASAAVLITGIALNVAARSKMSDCRSDSDSGLYASALNKCNSAGPLANTSYAMFGIAAAGAAVEAFLLLRDGGYFSSSESPSSSVGLLLLPSGGGLSAQGRF